MENVDNMKEEMGNMNTEGNPQNQKKMLTIKTNLQK